MQGILPEFLGEIATLLLVTAGSVLFTGIGILGEQAAIANLASGQSALGAWEVFIGTWALFVGVYLLGVKQVLPRIRALGA